MQSRFTALLMMIALAGVVSASAQSPATPPGVVMPGNPPLTQQISDEAARLIAFAFGQSQLTPPQMQLLQQELIRIWQSGNAAEIAETAQIPQFNQQVTQQLTAHPQMTEAFRQQLRASITQEAMMAPNTPLAQLVNQLGGGLVLPQPQQSATAGPMPGAVPPLTEPIMSEASRLVAFALGLQALQPQHDQMIRMELQRAWQSGDMQTIMEVSQIPQFNQQVSQQLTAQPQLTETVRAQIRSGLIEAAREDPQGYLAQVIMQVTGHPLPPPTGVGGGIPPDLLPYYYQEDEWTRQQREEAELQDFYHEQDLHYDRLEQDRLDQSIQEDYQYQESFDYSYDYSYD